MRLKLGEILYYLRIERELEAKQLCDGICSKSNMSYYEHNERPLDNLMFERFIERMGMFSEEFAFMVSEEEYIYRQWQEKVYSSIENAMWGELKTLLEFDLKGDGWINEKLQMQFYYYVRGIYLGSQMEYEEAVAVLKKAAELTISNRAIYNRNTLLNTMELHILMLYLYYGRKSFLIDEGKGKRLFSYLESFVYNGLMESEIKAKLYPKLVCIGLHCIEDQFANEEKIELCEKAIGLLRRDMTFFDITELLRLYSKMLEKNGDREYFFYKKQYEVFRDLLQEEHIDIGFRPELQGFHKPKLYLMHEYFLYKRQENEWTQEKLSEGICETETYSRIEGGRRAPSRKNYGALAQKLGIRWMQYRGEINSSNLKAYHLRRLERTANIEGHWKDSLELIHELEKVLDMEIVENYQYIKCRETISNYRLGMIPLEETCKELKELLLLTQKMDGDTTKLVYYSQTEMEIIACLAQIYGKQKKYIEGIELIETMIQQMSHSKLGYENQWNGFSFIFRVLARLYFEKGEYDISIQISKYVKKILMQRREGFNLSEVLDEIADNLEHKGERYSEEYKKLYRYTYYVADFFSIRVIAEVAKRYYEENFEPEMVWYES